MMRADSLTGQVVAVLSRRTPAFQPVLGEPVTFPGRVHQASVVLTRPREHKAGAADTDAGPPAGTSDPDIIAIPPDGRPRSSHSPRGGAYRPINSPWLVAGIGAAAVVTVAIVAVLLASNIRTVPVEPISRSSTPSFTTPTPSAATSQSSAAISEQQAATSLAMLLTVSVSDRTAVVDAVNDISSCGSGLSQSLQTLNSAVSSREQLLNQLAHLPGRSNLPPALVTDLTKAWHADVAADQAYGHWASDEITQGCVPNDTSDPGFQATVTPNQQATIYKEAFINKWNPIATHYGLATYQPGRL